MGKADTHGFHVSLKPVLDFIYKLGQDKPFTLSKEEYTHLIDTIRICQKTLDRYERNEQFQDDGK